VRSEELPSTSADRVSLSDLTLITVTPAIAAERQLATQRGALVVSVGPSWQRSMGLQPGDVILQINNQPINAADQVGQVIEYFRGRGAMRFFIARGDQVRYADMWGTPQ
jgi:S1-C subfamily serine protease